MPSIRRRTLGIRASAAAAVLSATVALTAAPAAHAQPGTAPVKLTAAQLATLSARYTPRSDGTPGIVAAAEEAGGASSGTTSGGTTSSETTSSGTTSAPTTATGTTTVDQQASWETARGAASTLALSGTGDWAAVFSGGTVARYNAKGLPVWQITSHELMTDWQVKPTLSYQPEEYTPVLYEGYDPYQPDSTGTHPYAQLDVNHDGVADIAVAYSVGASPARPFTSPGSTLEYGTFVSILDGRTGKMLWHTLVPGYVGSLLAEDGKLVVADRTGPDWGNDPVAAQGDSRSSLLAYDFGQGKGGAVTGRTAWTYSTDAPWASWSDVEPLTDGRLTASWADTPMGLGSPRPAAGHVLVLDTATGHVTVDAQTPGYPRILHQEPGADKVLVAEQNDPMDAVRWSLTTIDARTGKRTVVATRENTVPEAFVVNPDQHGKQAAYAVAELGINPTDLSDGQSTVSGWNAQGRTLWSHQTASTVGGANAPTLSVQFDPQGSGAVYAAVADPTQIALSTPEGLYHSQLLAYDASSGGQLWRREGDVVGDQVTLYQGRLLTVGYDLTGWTTDARHGTATALPLLGDAYSAVSADVNGDGVKDLIVAGQSHGVFALDGRDLNSPTPHVLWATPVSGAVHQLQLAAVTDSHHRTAQRIVAATSDGVAVLEPGTGRLDADVDTGVYQYGTAVTAGEIVATGAQSVAAFTADGTRLWSYRPAGTTGKQVLYSTPTATADGRVVLEYGGLRTAFGTGPSDPAPTAVALDAATGKQQWSEQPNDATAAWIEQQAGAYASPYVPGTSGHGVALAWGGDKPATGAHLVQFLDDRTGAVVSTHQSVGASTFQGFAASKSYGLVELHAYQATVFPADGSASYDVSTIANIQQGVFATTTSGAQAFVAGTGGLLEYAQPFPHSSDYVESTSSAFSLFAGTVTPVQLGGGKATELVGLPFDWSAYAINQTIGAFGADQAATDSYQHGVTLQRIDDSGTASSSAATAPKAPAAAQVTAAAAVPVTDPPLASGTATPPLRIKATHKVNVFAADPSGTGATETTTGYTPQQVQARLGLTGDGTGQTVTIVDAYDYPTAEADLNHFAAHFGLPQTCDSVAHGTDCFDFQQVYASGTKPAADANWNEEEALDIEWAHSVAPHAKIVLVEAADASTAALYAGVDKAAALHPAVISDSWGMSEFSEESFYDGHCDLADTVCTQSTGDDGYPAEYSSTSPYVLAIGGSTMQLDANGKTLGESAWNSTGGGLSYFEKRPAYQNGVQPSAYRATPDVSFDADPNTGVPVYTSAGGAGEWLEVGGTSLSAPVWGAILADADQLRAAVGKPHLAVAGPQGDTAHRDVYALGSLLNDVTTGSNGACGTECTAGPGYDTVTGLGSPLAGVDKALAAMK